MRTSVRLVSGISVLLVATAGAAAEREAEAPARPGVLDLIPAEACGAVGVRNVKELRERTQRFLEKTGTKSPVPLSDAFDLVYEWMGVRKGVNEDASAALMVLELTGLPVLGTVPYSDRKEMASNFELDEDELRPGRIVLTRTRGERAFWRRNVYVTLEGGHALVAKADKQTFDSYRRMKRLRAELDEPQRRALERADVLFHMSTKGFGRGWEQVVKSLEQWADRRPDRAEARVVHQLGQVLRNLTTIEFGADLDNGLGLIGLARFQEDEATADVLSRLAGGPGSSDLRGLPRGDVVFAYGTKGEGSRSVELARALIGATLEGIPKAGDVISTAHRPLFLGLFGEVWGRLKGSRAAVYASEDPEKHGALAMIAILDTEDPDKFLADMRELGRFINHAGEDLATSEDKGITEAEIRRLIGDLGSPDYRTRETATTKLALAGDAVLPFLDEAAKSNDAETAFRARMIRDRLQKLAADRRKALRDRDWLSRLKPQFEYAARAETRAGVPTGVITVHLPRSEREFAPELRKLLGPEWNKICVAVHGRQVVVLFGSRTELLDETLANLKDGTAGLADDPALAEFYRRCDAGRKVEMHVSLMRAQKLIDSNVRIPEDLGGSFSSLALTVAPSRIQFDAFIPYAEAAVISKVAER